MTGNFWVAGFTLYCINSFLNDNVVEIYVPGEKYFSS